MSGPADRFEARSRSVRRVLAAILGLNLLVAAAKAVAGHLGGVLSLQADAYHSAFDAGSNVIGLISIALAMRPPDPRYPYGHRKLEVFGAALIGVFLALAAWTVLGEAVSRMASGAASHGGPLQLGVAGATLAINIGVAAYESRAARRLGSALLGADAAHTWSDVLTTGAVIAALLAPAADAWISMGIAAMIALLGVRVLRRTASVLADRAVLDSAAVARVAMAVPGVRDCHEIRTRGAADAVFVDLRIHLDPKMTLEEAHARCHDVEERLRAAFPGVRDVVVHPEPEVEGHR